MCFPPVSRTTGYIDQMSAWYDKRTAAEVVNLKLWEQLKVSLVARPPLTALKTDFSVCM